MKKKNVLNNTTNSKVYNHTKKNYLYNYGVCDYCHYHRGCNKRNHYGGFTHKSISYPNWKLVSKNHKQWMEKPLKKNIEITRWQKMEYVTFKW